MLWSFNEQWKFTNQLMRHQLLLRIRTQYVWYKILMVQYLYPCTSLILLAWNEECELDDSITSHPSVHLSIHPSIHLFILYLYPFWTAMVFTLMHTVAMRHIKWNTNNQRTEFMASFLVRESNFYQVLESGSIPLLLILMNATWPVNSIRG